MTRTAGLNLLDGFSLEITGRDSTAVSGVSPALPSATKVNVTFLGSEAPDQRIATAGALLDAGLSPVPHIAARRLTSHAALEGFLARLQTIGASDTVFVVGGDPAEPEGPFPDSDAVIRSGLLTDFGVRSVGIAGYPEGHPLITDEVLWSLLENKVEALASRQLEGTIITQFGFDETPVLRWIEEVRNRGIDLPVRIGVPGPAGVKRLIGYAKRFGVGASAMIVKKYGLSLTNLMSTAGPANLLEALASGLDSERHGVVRLHFYTFGGVEATTDWITQYRAD